MKYRAHSAPRLAQITVAVFAILCATSCAQHQDATPPTAAGWHLVWSDEFNGPDNSAPDPAKWNLEVSGNGFGNNELEYYTNRLANAHIAGGNLVITAQKESFTGPDGVTRQYTSARLNTKGHFTQQNGRFEARIKLPPGGQGLWPAFWMLGDNIDTVNWPDCGEVDIMEAVGFEPTKNHGSMHGPGYSGNHSLTGIYTLPGNARFSDDFHIFTMEWESGSTPTVRFYVDGVLYETQTPANLPPNSHWVFDHPFFLLLNLAVGGDWPGSPDQTTVLPSSMLVDYVRVYAKQ